MKRILFTLLALISSGIVYMVGCSSSNTPASPGPSGPTVTSTFTPNLTLGTATNTPTFTATLNLTLGTATNTNTVLPTHTPTNTETPLCVSSYSFGRNFQGGTNSTFSPLNLLACRYTLPIDGKVTALHAYCPNTIGPNIRMALYADTGSAPGALISESSPQVSVGGWNTVNIPNTGALATGTYWIALVSDGTLGLSFDTGITGDTQYQGVTFGPLPGIFTGGSSTDWNFSFYADYCVGAGTPTPVSTITWTPTNTYTSTFTITPTQTQACAAIYSFGRNYNPSGAVSMGLNDGSIFSRFTLPVAGIVSQLHGYIIAPNSDSLKMGIYSDTGSAPGTLISSSNSQAAAAGWNSFAIPATPLLPAGTYWLAAGTYSPSTALYFADDDYSLNADSSDGYIHGFAILPATFAGSGPNQTSFYFYADYCVPAGSPTPVNSPTLTRTPTMTWTPTFTHTQTPACVSGYSFGKNYLSYDTLEIDNGTTASRYTLPVAGSVSKLHVYVASTAGQTIQMGLYTNGSSQPGNLIAASNPQVSVVGWNNLSIPATFLSAGTYWIAYANYLGGTGPVISTDSNTAFADPADGYSTFSVIPTGAFSGSGPFYRTSSFYADYCVIGASPTPIYTSVLTSTPTMTFTPTMTTTEVPLCAGGSVTLGKTTTGANNGGFSNNNMFFSKYVYSSTGKTVIKLGFWNPGPMPTPYANVRMAIYTNNASVSPNAPLSLISQSSVQIAGLGANTVDIPDRALTVSGPTTFWIGLVHDSYGNLPLSYDSTTVTGDGYIYSGGFTSFPTVFPGGTAIDWRFTYWGITCP